MIFAECVNHPLPDAPRDRSNKRVAPGTLCLKGRCHSDVPWRGDVLSWHAESFESLAVEHFARIAALAPELVIFGSGMRLRFPAPSLLRPLIDAGIGVETMDTAAACRTYNVLLAEGRSVVAGLLFNANAAAVR